MFDAAPSPGPAPPLDPDLALQLPGDAYWHLIHTLRLALPPPPGDRPEDLLRRDHAAVARIAALAPGNAVEADLAAQFVAASEQWKDCLRLAQDPDMAPKWAAKCRAQALAMMRQANAALRLLLRLQARREKLEADNVTRDRAAWTEYCAIALMAEALAPHPHPDPLPKGEGEKKPSPSGRGSGEGESAEQPSPSGRGLGEGEPAPNVSQADPPSHQSGNETGARFAAAGGPRLQYTRGTVGLGSKSDGIGLTMPRASSSGTTPIARQPAPPSCGSAATMSSGMSA